MILKVAWRNIWRNKVRSTVVIIAIAIGLWAGVFASAFVVGMMNQKIKSVIQFEMSHFQVHHPKFRDELQPEFTIPESDKVVAKIAKEPRVKNITKRVISMPMLGSANKNGAIKVVGISPKEEAAVTQLNTFIQKGKYFEGVKKNPILISQETAEEYKIKVRSKVVLTLKQVDGEITSGAFRVVGIYKTNNNMYDKMNAFVRMEDLQKLLMIGSEIHEIAVLLKEHDQADPVANKFKKVWPELEVKSWMDLAPGMRFMVEAKDTYAVIIVGIILVALLFSIINTMLMAVLERVRELGMLMAIGMGRWKVFQMIMLETIFLALIGGPLGLLLSWSSIAYFGSVGINLSSAAYVDYGMASMVYPELDISTYITVTAMVFSMALLAAIYPARKALKLVPIEAIRKT
jgi:putative ABC transport system permease protein